MLIVIIKHSAGAFICYILLNLVKFDYTNFNFTFNLRILYALSNVLLCMGVFPDESIRCQNAIKEKHTPNTYLTIT